MESPLGLGFTGGNSAGSYGDIYPLIQKYGDLIDFYDLLPGCIPLDGKPMDIANRRPMFKPMFQKERRARRQVYICARQIGKTVSAAGSIMMNLNWRKNFRILYVAPLSVYTHRLHHMYMGPMMRGWNMPWPIQDRDCVNNVNEKTFLTGGHFHGVSCFNNAGNALGITADMIIIDETQDLNYDFIPQINQTVNTSSFRWESFFGTARGMEGTLQQLFDTSCQYEWVMRCPCGLHVVPTMDKHAISMVQKKGIACPDCSRLLDVTRGEWVPRFRDREDTFQGYHIPQTIVYDRITPHDRYIDTIYNKHTGLNKYSLAKFQQEILGISSDQGGRPITQEEVDKVSILPLDEESVSAGTIVGHPVRRSTKLNEYFHVAGGVDWGGSEQTSFTVGTLVGLHVSGNFHVLGAIRPTGIPDNDRHFPIAAFLRTASANQVSVIGADAQFVGSVQNRNLQEVTGIDVGSISYGTMKHFSKPLPYNNYVVDRTTLHYIIFSLIRDKKLIFPRGDDFKLFTNDLMAIYVEEMQTPTGDTVRRYARYTSKPDDFMHSLGYAIFMCATIAGVSLTNMCGLGDNGSLSRGIIQRETASEEAWHPYLQQ